MISVLSDLCVVSGDGRKVTVILESDSLEELNSMVARNEAVKHAGTLGVVGGGISNQSGTYPVDADGNSNEDVIMGRVPVAKYRNDIEVATARP